MDELTLQGILDDVALTAVMLTPGDLADMGRLLSKLEIVIAFDDAHIPPVAKKIAQGVKTILEGVILSDGPEDDKIPEQLNQAVALLQESCRQTSHDGDAHYIKNFNRIFGKTILVEHEGEPFDQNDVSSDSCATMDMGEDREDRECFVGFVAEAIEYLQQIEIDILALEQAPGNHDHINAIFRPFHTMKGLSGFLNLTDMHRLTHDTETILDKARNNELQITPRIIDLILDVVDILRRMTTDIKEALEVGVLRIKDYGVDQCLERIRSVQEQAENNASSEERAIKAEGEEQILVEPHKIESQCSKIDINLDEELISNFVSESLEHLQQIEVDLLALEQSPDDQECLNAVFRPFHTIKGVAGFLNLHAIKKIAHETENLLDKARNGEMSVTSQLTDLILDIVDVLKRMITDARQIAEAGISEQKDYNLDHYLGCINAFQEGRPSDAKSSLPKPPKVSTPEPEPARTKAKESDRSEVTVKATAAPVAATSVTGNAIKVDSSKLDNLVDMVGELVIVQSLIFQNPNIRAIKDQKLIGDFSQLNRITTELQKTSMSLRMVPIKQTFQKMIRLVRDLAKKSGKSVELYMNGEDTEIDRNMVDAIYDPLVHMIRNATDHGIELPENRRAKGKPEGGSIWLRAYQKGDNIIIEIQDDGQGLSREKIVKKAREKGLIKNTEALSVFEIDNLIFQPGFSTADKITDVSGRGVGMDVVKKAIEKLRGRVEINSEPGVGSTFTIKLPLTLAIIDGIIVKVGPERYIIPTTAIKETIRPREEEYSTVHGRGEMIRVRGNLIPLIRLHRMFNIESQYKNPCQALVVVVENEGRQKCLLIDDLLGKQEAVIKSLGEHMKNIRGLAGGTILGDGRVGLILDMNGLFSVAEEQAICI